jgi:DNA damage-inducible protein 1
MSKLIQTARDEHNQRTNDYQRMLTADPFDPEAQRMIEEEIQKKNIQRNMEHAIEYSPEVFASVTMLYIDCKVNGTPFKAFVDSGAQQTIMSLEATKKCNISHLIDRRWCGIAQGVGTQKIIGKIHVVDMGIESVFIPTSFSVLENQPMDILLGLDLLKRYQCCIDLKTNQLIIGSTGTATRFLTEAEMPKTMKTPGNYLPSGSFTEKDVNDLVNMGFNKSEVVTTLGQFNGDKDLAVAALVSKRM